MKPNREVVERVARSLEDFDDECGDGFRMSEVDQYRDLEPGAHDCNDFAVFRIRREAATLLRQLVRERDGVMEMVEATADFSDEMGRAMQIISEAFAVLNCQIVVARQKVIDGK